MPLVAVTVAVKVTDCPGVDGFTEEPNVVVVGLPFTVSVRAAEELPWHTLSPLYDAVIECDPAPSELVESDATPFVRTTLASTAEPSRNWTLPVGVPPAPDTVAVNVIACPVVDGFTEEPTLTVVGNLPALTPNITSTQ